MTGKALRGLFLFLAATTAWAEETETQVVEARVEVSRQGGAEVTDAWLPGSLLDRALPRMADGSRKIVLLVAVRSGEEYVGGPGWVRRFGPVDGSSAMKPRRILVEGSGVDLRSRPDLYPSSGGAEGSSSQSSTTGLYLTRVGALDLFGPPRFDRIASVPIPVQAQREPGGIRLRSPAVSVVQQGTDLWLYAVGPEAFGRQRLRSLLVDATTGETWETWSQLPGPEVVQWSWYRVINGHPMLLVTTNSADKLGVFEHQQLRVFALSQDRTRAGKGPILVAKTASNRWHRLWHFVVDVNADGRDDLVLLQTDGMGGGKLVAEAWLANDKGGFETRAPRTAMDRPMAAPLYGPDFTGDGVPDLTIANEGEISVFPGIGSPRKKLVGKDPRWVFKGGKGEEDDKDVDIDFAGAIVRRGGTSALNQLQAIDLDGDGKAELVYPQSGRHKPGRFRVIRWP